MHWFFSMAQKMAMSCLIVVKKIIKYMVKELVYAQYMVVGVKKHQDAKVKYKG